MPLTINQYGNWALNRADSTEAALDKQTGQLDLAANKVGTLARFFGTKSAQNVRKEVMADFTRALTAAYGVSLAQEALSAAGLTPTSKLTAKTISSVCSYAFTQHSNAISATLRQDNIKLFSGAVSRADISSRSNQSSREYFGMRRLAVDILGETPLDINSLGDFMDRASAIRNQLAHNLSIRFGERPEDGTVDAMIYDDASALILALERKIDEMQALVEDRPLSETNVKMFKAVWARGAMKALDALKSDKKCSQALSTAIDTVKQNITAHPEEFRDSLPVTKDMQKEITKTILALLKEQVPAKEIKFKEDFIAKQVSAGYCQALNEEGWDPIVKAVTVTVGGVPVGLTSEIVPAVNIGAQSADYKGPIGERYEPAVNGYMCHSASTSHAVNLAVSAITLDGADKPAFLGIRHGVHCAWEISSPTERAAANVKRAEEAVIAAFLADPDNEDKIENGEIRLNMVSVSLLTPDIARHIKTGKSSDERLMLREQKAAWDAVSRDGVTFQHNGRTITIRPTVFTFNFGVNAGAVKYSSVAPNLAGGWGMSDEMNRRAHRDMRPFVEAFVNDTNIPEAKRKAVRTLFNQCMPVLRKSGERSDDHDAYKVAARFAVLTHLMGWTPCWNCKSGKDRTGQMDVECKFLATLIARGEDIPEPGAKLTKEQSDLLRAIALEGGNFEMQRYNTGFAGFKTGGVSSIPERLGGQKYREFHKGGSENVGV